MLALVASLAFACPTIATGTTAPLSFDTAQVAMVREGQRTTFSVSINPAGDPQSFALVLPVPTVLKESEIKTLDPTIFGRLNGYTGPRHVDDAGCLSSGGTQDDYSDTGGIGGDGGGKVDVEATYLVGEYEVVILSAEESLSLETWLSTNGYHLPDGADERLAEYIEMGSYFLAAKVAEGADLADGSSLSPLQVSYDSDGFTIPLRLATLNSPGEQDMIVYAITSLDARDGGRVGIANYPEFTVGDKCRWDDPDGDDDFANFYESAFTKDWAAVGDAGWTVEYAGAWNDCNPCSATSITAEDIAALGFTGAPESHHLTRIHSRYTPAQASQDLVLYASGLLEPKVTAYADNTSQNECIEQLCMSDPLPEDSDLGDDLGESPGDDDKSAFAGTTGCGCASGDADGGVAGLAGLGALGIALRRRRRG
jgi:MYXO-CTERM domain-containing protein